ncbi:PD-(D/E)XK nuclease family protein [Priestia megaterium]|uniref:PD-(D/E)XK nuclease family protein n=1 Tax=Priestia megaterium TaxID=1404 RepID=A0A6H1P4Z0_PRIMG|nr:PD-(D/E)XK nuclease family protein [Priestia megaterium]QIZ08502.1 PD-(D/E)XK nuclease family protein [Priestia megaterium]
MNCKVITYTNPKTLDQLDGFKLYTDVLHVCATKNMRDGVYERYQQKQNQPFITAPIVSGMQLIESLLGEWYSSQTKLKQYLQLSEIIQNEIQLEENFLASFRRNQIEVLETIRTMELSGVSPSNLDNKELVLSEKEKIFLSIWSRFEANSAVKNVRNLLTFGLKNTLENDWNKMVNKMIADSYKTDEDKNLLHKINPSVSYDTIVLHGFYFMTPEQQRVFLLLKDAGVNIVFLNLYDQRYPETFSFIERFISERNGWVDKEQWEIEKYLNQESTLADKFLADYEGELIENYRKPAHLKVKNFQDFYEFLQDYETNLEIPAKYENAYKTYLAPNAASLNDRLQEYYPEMFKAKRHFLGYPIGQFLYQLHQMWSEAEETLILAENGLFECFASGWLYDKETKKNARAYTKVLQEVLPFFQGCVTQESWRKRADELISILENVLPAFQQEDDDSFQRNMSSPFTMFSQFAAAKEDVLQLVDFIDMIMNIAVELFGDGSKRISLTDHFSKLRQLVEASNPYLQQEILEEEKILINQLKKTLQTTPDIGAFQVSDISTAISLYLSGHLNRNNPEEELIRPFIEIDGEAFKEKGITHVTGLDENSLPYSEFKLPWPLSNQVFNDLAERNIPLSFQVLRNDSVKEITRYLVYNLLQFSNRLELSWMVQWEDKKNLDKAVYLSQLNLKPNLVDFGKQEEWLDVKLKRDITKQELDSFLAYPIDALAEFKFCPRRFYYSYLSGSSETFQSEFVHEFLFGNLLKAVAALLPALSDEKIKEEVSKLFPYWNEFKLNIIAEENLRYRYWAKKYYGGYTPYGVGEEFSDLRKLFLFPALQNRKADDESKMVATAIEQLYRQPDTILPTLREEFEKQLQEYPIQMEATPSGKCRYCPHNHICPEAFHPVDDAERKRAK